jgi:hypothetical protein
VVSGNDKTSNQLPCSLNAQLFQDQKREQLQCLNCLWLIEFEKITYIAALFADQAKNVRIAKVSFSIQLRNVGSILVQIRDFVFLASSWHTKIDCINSE